MMRRVTTRWRDGKGPYEGRIVAQYDERIPSFEERERRHFAKYRNELAEKHLRLDQERLEELVDAVCDAEGGEG